MFSRIVVAALLLVALRGSASDVFTVRDTPSAAAGMTVPATFHLWLPPGVKRVRAVIVHQHGCGEGAEKSGETAAFDLHWRALAERHDAALLAPHYSAGTNKCTTWSDPRQGSDLVFRRALTDLGKQTGHPELADVPWCLWGHSGGGFWASLMLALHPERIVAVFCRSGAAHMWERDTKGLEYSPAALEVPVVLNPGIKERGHAQFNGAWTGSLRFFEEFRAKGAPVAFAPDPLSSHECRNSRLLAIPFFDACLEQRLPRTGHILKPVNQTKGYQGNWQTGETRRARQSDRDGSWLPNATVARAFSEYVRTGVTTDTTPPKQAPVITNAIWSAHGVLLEWSARADFESGVRQFGIYRDGEFVTRFPEKPKDPTGFAQYQTLSYHDTPTPDAPKLRFIDTNAPPHRSASYAVSIINGAGLEGPRSKAVKVPAQRAKQRE